MTDCIKTEISEPESITFDALRGGAALVVFLAHIVEWFLIPYLPAIETPVSILAGVSVFVFFALSGQFIFLSIVRNAARSDKFDFRRYAFDRITRLWPVLGLSLAVTCVSYVTIKLMNLDGDGAYALASSVELPRGGAWLSVRNIVGSGFFLNGIVPGIDTPSMNGPLWSLSFEAWFYLFGGLLGVMYYNSTRRVVSGILLVVLLGALAAVKEWQLLWGFGIWIVGAIGFATRSIESRRTKRSIVVCLLISAVTVFAVAIGTTMSLQLMRYVIGTGLALVLAAVVAQQLSWPVAPVRVLSRTAGSSYTLYALHWPLLQLAYGCLSGTFHQATWLVRGLLLLPLGVPIYLLTWWLAKWFEDTRMIRGYLSRWLARGTSAVAQPPG